MSFILPILLVWLQSCAHRESNDALNSAKEIWEFELSGDTRGNCKMMLGRTKVEGDVFKIAGSFSGKAYDYIGGFGEIDCKFQGQLEKSNIDCGFSGWGDMDETVFLEGSFRGILGDMEGAGEWQVSHVRGSSSGTWKMKRRSL